MKVPSPYFYIDGASAHRYKAAVQDITKRKTKLLTWLLFSLDLYLL